MALQNKNFTATVSKLLELKANPDVKEITGKTAKEYAENKIKDAIADYTSDDYDYFKDKFLNCECASMKRDENNYDVIDVDWESCFDCEHGPCYFDWSSINPGGSWSNNLNQMNHKVKTMGEIYIHMNK